MQKIIKFLVISFFLFVIVVFFLSLGKDFSYDTKKLIGNKLSEVNLEKFYGNNNITNQDIRKNEFTLLNFWASWCGPCRDEHPILMKLNKEKNIKLLGVNFKDKRNNAIFFLKEFGNPYDLLAKDRQGKYSVNFGIYGIPESILVDKNLIIIKKYLGPLNNNDYNEIKEIIN